ncbi:hypothetical protein BZG36_02548 [Bifiguratus adelaidae]|uniref:Uncharacterized protein n=1 Tax=Bifiguratus adelaidae TaxID=1938954 RepID=A0A261Y226_9FUNG|nr:hypothetical protein BZG36_02548 [Bifiguratus adelaidae]
MVTLQDLPHEILIDIFLYSSNPQLVITSKGLYQYLANLPASVKAEWLMIKYAHDPRLAFHHGVRWAFFNHDVLRNLDKRYQAIARLELEEGKRDSDRPQKRRRLSKPTLAIKAPSSNALIPISFAGKKVPYTFFDQSPTPPERIALIETLLTRGANVNEPNGYPIIRSSSLGNQRMIKLLLSYGADPSIRKNSALKLAAGHGHVDTVRLLLENGVKPDADVLKITVKKEFWDIVKLLMDHGAVPDMATLNTL